MMFLSQKLVLCGLLLPLSELIVYFLFEIANIKKKWKNMCYVDEILIILLLALPKWFLRLALSSHLVFLLQLTFVNINEFPVVLKLNSAIDQHITVTYVSVQLHAGWRRRKVGLSAFTS